MLCCTSVLSYVLRSLVQGLGELLYAVLQICALIPGWTMGELLHAVLHISAVSVLLAPALGLRRAVLCCAVHLCCHLCSDLRPQGLGELLYAVLHIYAVSLL